ncbi:hypothetical protein MKZ38_006153 [Zalerion maritima]|uniref:Chitin-binding type-1 domain-containing protein n=1 Tax=Zalerion maritima TaxID=339359 RepID=A0AAD5RKA0_9PEZI|nr:hypothetical protein MKZ38_006153 [Zalerion maritima]
MENGSGGFFADLTFVGGKFGAYFGNQQCTSSRLVFVNCAVAVQVRRDWAWTMQDHVIERLTCFILHWAGGPVTQGARSLVLTDSIIPNTEDGIVTSLLAENSTSFLLQNVGVFNVHDAAIDSTGDAAQVLIPGATEKLVDNWGSGRVNNATGETSFINGADLPTMSRAEVLLGNAYDNTQANFFTPRRPNYYNIPASNVMSIKEYSATGHGETGDEPALNSILTAAANTSSVVYFPFGIHVVKDTPQIPIGSRIIGQAWSQIMGKGAKFGDEMAPRPVVRVELPGEVGIIETQDMLFTVSGPTAGAIVVKWNAKEQSQGSAGLWGLFPSDPDFSLCWDDKCAVSWGLRILESSQVYLLDAGAYSFCDEYTQACLDTNGCQTRDIDALSFRQTGAAAAAGRQRARSCLGSGFGACCSEHGYCGSDSDYCGTGCQGDFGIVLHRADPSACPPTACKPAAVAIAEQYNVSKFDPAAICFSTNTSGPPGIYGRQYSRPACPTRALLPTSARTHAAGCRGTSRPIPPALPQAQASTVVSQLSTMGAAGAVKSQRLAIHPVNCGDSYCMLVVAPAAALGQPAAVSTEAAKT